MAEIEQTAPTFTVLGKTEAVAADDKVTVYFGTEDRKRFKLGFAAGIIPALIFELTARLKELRPAGDQTRTAEIRPPGGLQLAVRNDGEPALILQMDGYELAAQIDRAGLKSLHDDIGQFLNPN